MGLGSTTLQRDIAELGVCIRSVLSGVEALQDLAPDDQHGVLGQARPFVRETVEALRSLDVRARVVEGSVRLLRR